MIKVRFYTDDRDVCSIMEEKLTGGIEIEDWLMQRIDGISFDSMDVSCTVWVTDCSLDEEIKITGK